MCNFTSDSDLVMSVHLRRRHTYGRLQCEFCNFRTGHYGSLSDHVKLQHQRIDRACHLCPYIAVTTNRLILHKCYVHGLGGLNIRSPSSAAARNFKIYKEKIYKCKLCYFRTSSMSGLQLHKATWHLKKEDEDDHQTTGLVQKKPLPPSPPKVDRKNYLHLPLKKRPYLFSL